MIKIPNKFVVDFNKYGNIEYRIIVELFKSMDVGGKYNGNIKSLLYFSNVDKRYSNRILKLIESMDGKIHDGNISINLEKLFSKNEYGKYVEYLQLKYDITSIIENRNILKYYCYMLYNINIFKCYKQTYKQLTSSTNISEPTLLKYNKELMDKGLIYYVNSGDLWDNVNKIVINSSNFYSTKLSIAQDSLDEYMSHSKNNLGWTNKKESTITTNDKRRATQYINTYGKKDTLTEEEYAKLVYGMSIYADLNKVDYDDKQEMIDIKIKSLMDRYNKCGLDFGYDKCLSILKGEIKIRDAIED